jgi:hypothetical protein
MKTKISIEHYIATNNPLELNYLLNKRGIPSAKNVPDAIKKLRYVMTKEGNNVLKEIAEINTPYRDLILSAIDKKEEKSNACGCSSFNGETFSNCEGGNCKCKSNFDDDGKSDDSKKNIKSNEDKIEKFIPYVAVGLLLIVTTAVLIKN